MGISSAEELAKVTVDDFLSLAYMLTTQLGLCHSPSPLVLTILSGSGGFQMAATKVLPVAVSISEK